MSSCFFAPRLQLNKCEQLTGSLPAPRDDRALVFRVKQVKLTPFSWSAEVSGRERGGGRNSFIKFHRYFAEEIR